MSPSSRSRADQLTKNVRALFGDPPRGICRVCNDEVDNRRRHYCSKKCQRIAYAVLERYQWDRIREEVLDRDDRRCVRCGDHADELDAPLEVDHIVPLSHDGAALDPRNLQTLCPDCHDAKGTDHTDYRSDEWDRHPGDRDLSTVDVRSWVRSHGRPSEVQLDLDRNGPPSVRVLDPDRFTSDYTLRLEEPQPPEELPEYVVDPIDRQELEALERVREYVTERLAYLAWKDRQPIGSLADAITADRDEVVTGERVDTDRGTYFTKWVPCGSECSGCPHGPYTWLYYRDNGEIHEEYIGRGRAREYAGANVRQ